MIIKSNLSLNFDSLNDFYFDLLKEEDFDFKTKDINILISKSDSIDVQILCNSVLEFKIASNALIKSLEVINKTLEI